MGTNEATEVESIPRRSVIGCLLLRSLPLAVSAVHSLTPAHCTGVAAASSPSPLSLLLHRCVVPVRESNRLFVFPSADDRRQRGQRESAAAAVAAEADGEGRRGNTARARRMALGEGAKQRKSSDNRDVTGAQGDSTGMRRRREGRERTVGHCSNADSSRNGGQHSIDHVLMHEDALTPAAGLVHGAVSGMAKVPSAEENRSRKSE